MYPFSSYIFQRIFHEQMLQEAMEQAHIDAQLRRRDTPHRIPHLFLRLFACLPLPRYRRRVTVEPIDLKKNSYSHCKTVSYSDRDAGTTC